MKTTRTLLAALALACVMPACGPSYNIISMEDHPTKELTIIDVEASRPVVPGFYYVVAREFWMCEDAGGTLDCKRACTPFQETSTQDLNNPDLVLCPNVGDGVSVKRTRNPNINISRGITVPTGGPVEPAEPAEQPPLPPPTEEPPATPDAPAP